MMQVSGYSCNSCQTYGMTEWDFRTHGCFGTTLPGKRIWIDHTAKTAHVDPTPKPTAPEVFSGADFSGHGSTLDRRATQAAKVANRLLAERATVVYGHVKEGSPSFWGPREDGRYNDTHTALLINVQPIIRESEERALLREFIETFGQVEGSPVRPWAERVKRLLEREGK